MATIYDTDGDTAQTGTDNDFGRIGGSIAGLQQQALEEKATEQGTLANVPDPRKPWGDDENFPMWLANEQQKAKEKDDKKEQRRQRRSAIFAALGDGISALSNLYFTTKEGLNVHRPATGMSNKVTSTFAEMKKQRDADRANNYTQILNGFTAQQQLRQAREKAEREKAAAEKAQKNKDREFEAGRADAKQKQDNWKQEFDAAREDAAWKKKQAEDAAEEGRRHNRASEGIAWAKARASSGGGGKAIPTLKVHDYTSKEGKYRNFNEKSFRTMEDYEKEVRKYAKMYGISEWIKVDTGKKDSFGKPIYETQRKTTKELAAQVEAKADEKRSPYER